MTTPDLTRWSERQTDPLRNFKYFVEFQAASNGNPMFDSTISGFSGGFTSVQGLAINTQAIGYREGGFNTTVHQIPGQTSFQPIVLSRGMIYGQDQAITWMRGLFAAAAGQQLPLTGADFRLDVKIYVQDQPSANTNTAGINNVTSRAVFTAHNAWITGLSYSDLNGTDNNLLFETMTLVHEGLDVFFTDPTTNNQITSHSYTTTL
jgi:phage tail-like protein